MKKLGIYKYEIISTIFVIILGVLLHFTYDLSNHNIIVSLFSAINESIWEHLKLVFFPLILTSIIGFILYKRYYPDYLTIKTKSILLSMSFIIIFFYTYSGILGHPIVVIDISLFFASIILGEIYSFKQIKSNNCDCNNLSIIILFILLFSFLIFTFYPPHIGIFKDPITGLYGI